jgi:HlyD family secretion protein
MRSASKTILIGAVLSVATAGARVWVWPVLHADAVYSAGADTGSSPPLAAANSASRVVTARGRLEPKDRVLKVAGPAQQVLSQLFIKEGDPVVAGEVIGVFDTYPRKDAAVARLQVELAEAERQFQRLQRLYKQRVVSTEEREVQGTKRDVIKAELREAQAERELARVRAPIDGRVLKVRAYPGEMVGGDGVCEIGQTDAMYAIAEVYEDDIGFVRVGQLATVTSPALNGDVHGTVEEIGWKIGKMDVLSTDPAAKTDARVVEVRIQLADSDRVAHLTNLQVEVRIGS